MTSLTPLHETYCRLDSIPPSQADLIEGLAQLVTVDLLGLNDFMQLLQREVLATVMDLPVKRSGRIMNTPWVQKLLRYGYQALQSSGRYVVAPALRQLNFRFPNLRNKPLTPALHYFVGALNGVLGNYLIDHHNPLALPMMFYDHYGQPQQGDLAGRVVILVHGLCMNHLSWSHGQYGGIGEKLLSQRDHNVILYLNYNTGRRISANGKTLARMLEDLTQQNPRIASIDLIGHSMGGLVCRSALFYGRQKVDHWVNQVGNLVCIASPHQGAVLERMGYMLEDYVGRLPFLYRLGKLGQIRSDGILDLRHGSVRDDDWEYLQGRNGVLEDVRHPAPLPARIKTYLIAGTIEFQPTRSKTLAAIGDYLVSVSSALGEHANPKFRLRVPDAHKAVFYGLNHMQIQYHSSVAEQVARWLYPPRQDVANTDTIHKIVERAPRRSQRAERYDVADMRDHHTPGTIVET